LLAGLTALLGLSPVQHLLRVQELLGTHIPSARIGLISIAATLIAMLLGSLFFPDRIPQHDLTEPTSGS